MFQEFPNVLTLGTKRRNLSWGDGLHRFPVFWGANPRNGADKKNEQKRNFFFIGMADTKMEKKRHEK